MEPLIRFLLVNLAGGFGIGLMVGGGFMLSSEMTNLFVSQPLGTAMLLWSFAASFAMGVTGTGLAFLSQDQ